MDNPYSGIEHLQGENEDDYEIVVMDRLEGFLV